MIDRNKEHLQNMLGMLHIFIFQVYHQSEHRSEAAAVILFLSNKITFPSGTDGFKGQTITKDIIKENKCFRGYTR